MGVIVTDADASFLEKWACIEELFSERPVWSKHMLMHHAPPILPKEEMTSLLSHFCYRFGDGLLSKDARDGAMCHAGPWRKLWIKKGYDPRTDSQAKDVQTILYSIPQTWYTLPRRDAVSRGLLSMDRYYRAAKSAKLTSMRDLVRGHTIVQMNRLSDREAKRSDAISSVCRFETWPLEKNTVLQLCDLEDDSIQSLLKDASHTRTSCSAETGWLTTEAWEQIQCTVRHRFTTIMEKTLNDVEEQRQDETEAGPSGAEDMLASLLTPLPSRPDDLDDVDMTSEEEDVAGSERG